MAVVQNTTLEEEKSNMKHIDDFTIHSFRGLRDVKLEGLGQINLLVGGNNTGKTSVLEALSIFCDPFNWRIWNSSAIREAGPSSTSLSDRILWLFPQGIIENKSTSPEIVLSSTGKNPLKKMSAQYEQFSEMIEAKRPRLEEGELIYEDGERLVEGIKVHLSAVTSVQENVLDETLIFANYRPLPSPSVSKQELTTLPVRVINPSSHRLGNIPSRLWTDVIYAEMKSGSIELLRSFDKDIQDVDITDKGRPEVSVKHRKLVRAPLSTFGDGLRRVFTLTSAIPSARGGLLLIDELETAMHFSILGKTLDWLIKACIKSDIQLFVTTHSIEMVDALLSACGEDIDLVTYRLQKNEDNVHVTRRNRKALALLREELGREVR